MVLCNPSRYSPPATDRIWLWVHHLKIPIYPIFYLLKGDYMSPIKKFAACMLLGPNEWSPSGMGRGSAIIRHAGSKYLIRSCDATWRPIGSIGYTLQECLDFLVESLYNPISPHITLYNLEKKTNSAKQRSVLPGVSHGSALFGLL